MPPKRPKTGPESPSRKKSKAGQASLSSFFASPAKSKADVKNGDVQHSDKAGAASIQSSEDDDAHFALKLAAKDAGVSLEEMRRRLGLAAPASAKADPLPVHPLFEMNKGKTKGGETHQDQASNSRLHTPPPTASSAIAGPSTPHKPPAFDFALLDASIAAIDFTQDVFTFDPRTVATEQWPRTSDNRPSTPYALLSHAFISISSTKSRLLIGTVLTNLMRTIKTLDPDNLLAAIYLITNHIAPNYEDVQLGIGGSITNKAIKSVTGKSARTLKVLWDATGDPGDVAFEAKKDVRPMVTPPPLTVSKLFSTLHAIAALTHSGAGSTNAKLSHVTKLLVAARGEESRWLVRTFHSHLRIGAVKKTLSSAIARCFSLVEGDDGTVGSSDVLVGVEERQGVLCNPTKPKDRQDPRRLSIMAKFAKAERLVREVFSRHPNFTSILQALLQPISEGGGLPNLSALVPLRIGVPISPMLGSITRSLSDVYTKLGVGTPAARAFVSEFKYDGQRVQIHARRIAEAAVDAESGKLGDVARAKRREVDSRGNGKWIGERGDIFVRLFSRHLEDMTTKYPDILDLIPMLMSRGADEDGTDLKPLNSFIIDAEVVAIGATENELLPFQTLSNRSRKDVNLKEVKVKVGVFAFDLMFLDGNSMLKSSLRLRRRLLHSRFPPLRPDNPLIARWLHVKSSESNDPEEVERFFQDARANRCEGIMVKTLDHHWQKIADADPSGRAHNDEQPQVDDVKAEDNTMQQLGDIVSEDLVMEEDDVETLEANSSSKSKRKAGGSVEDEGIKEDHSFGKGVSGRGKALLSTYEPDKRCESWLKVKQDYVDGIGDSLDLVPIAAWHGMGRKAAWWSPVLLAVYDDESGEYQAVCKCISGFTDAEYKSIKFERFPESEEPGASCYNTRKQSCRHSYDTGGYLPDVWFEPLEVWELRFADITLSPVYPAAKGLVSEERGVSCRFPRFIRRREDKGPEQASTPRQLAKMFFDQRSNVELGGPAATVTGEAVKKEEGAEEDAEDEESEGEASEHDEAGASVKAEPQEDGFMDGGDA